MMARREGFIPKYNVGYIEGCWLLDRDVYATGVTPIPLVGDRGVGALCAGPDARYPINLIED